jgi:hypothetical protein
LSGHHGYDEKARPMIQGVIERYEDDQLVVAISDLAVVRGALTDLPVGEQDVDPSPELGLALLTLQDVASGAAELRARDSRLEKRVKEAKRPAGSPKGIAPSDLDTLIFWLGEHFRSAYDGWIPTIGTNRVIDPVRGLPYLGGGSDGNPHFGGYGAVAAKIQPGRCDARQALACICEEPGGEIRRFVKPDR